MRFKNLILIFLLCISSLFSTRIISSLEKPENTVIVRQESDFGTLRPDGSRELKPSTVYDVNYNEIVVTAPLMLPYDLTGTATYIEKAFLYNVTGGTLFVTTTTYSNIVISQDSFFVGLDFGGGTGTFLDCNLNNNPQTLFLIKDCLVQGFDDLGSYSNYDVLFHYVNFIDCGYGFKTDFIFGTEFISCAEIFSKNYATSFITIDNLFGLFSVGQSRFECTPKKSSFNIKNTIGSANIQGNIFTSTTTVNVFAPNSLNQTDASIIAFGNNGLADSTVTSQLYIQNNTAITNVSAPQTPTVINAIWNENNTEIDLNERIVFQDICTFNSITDIITTSFTNELSTNDIITFFTSTGTLPTGLDAITEYYVSTITANTFQIKTSTFSSIVDFSDNGVGVNFYRHNSGATNSGYCIYVGREAVSLEINGWLRVENTTTNGVDVYAKIMKINLDGSLDEYSVGSYVNVSNTWSYSTNIINTIKVNTGEGIAIYIVNDTNSDNLQITDASVLIKKS